MISPEARALLHGSIIRQQRREPTWRNLIRRGFVGAGWFIVSMILTYSLFGYALYMAVTP